MNRKTTSCTALVIIALAAAIFGGCTSELTIKGRAPVSYRCEGGEEIMARYYSLSDGSLNFVKLAMPDGTVYTLPQVVSGSGARYTDERDLVWWIRGDEAFIQTRDENGNWEITTNCAVVSRE